jgi:hypothetical protein
MDTTELINSMVAEARPVRVQRRPLMRASLWLLLATVVIVLLGIEHGVRPDIGAQLQKTAFALGTAASLVTGALAAIGCLVASLPDRSRSWLLLPVPSLAVWLSTIGYGCLTDWVNFDSGTMRVGDALRCFATLLLVSLPLSASMFVMLRHAARLRPTMVTMTAGLAVAAITSTAMSLLHRLDATIMILMWNLGTAMVIVLIEGAAGKRILAWLDRTPAR